MWETRVTISHIDNKLINFEEYGQLNNEDQIRLWPFLYFLWPKIKIFYYSMQPNGPTYLILWNLFLSRRLLKE